MLAIHQDILFQKYKLTPNITLKNRIIMAPMTRRNADQSHNPTDKMIEYYKRRSDAGLIITEGSLISSDAIGYGNVPGIFTDEQITKWQKVTSEVHTNNGKIFLQLWHCGRVSHSSLHNNQLPIAPSETYLNLPLGSTGLICGYSQEASIMQIQDIIEDFAISSKNAISAGFDGVEIHGANGYLVDQFLHHCSNQRTDQYGATPANMARFCLEIIDACGNAIGRDRVGLRLSPGGHLNQIETSIKDSAVFKFLLNELNTANIAYIHTGAFDDSVTYSGLNNKTMTDFLRTYYFGNLIASGGYNQETAQFGLSNNNFDLIAFGRPFIANPNLVNILQARGQLIPYTPDMLERELF